MDYVLILLKKVYSQDIISVCIQLKTPTISRPMSNPKKISNATKSFMANFMSFQAITTINRPPSATAHNGI